MPQARPSKKPASPNVRSGRLTTLTPDPRNANKGTERGGAVVERSLRTYGAGRSILADKNGRIIAGNKTLEAAASIGLDDAIIVRTDGTQIVVVQRTDLDLERDVRAKELAVADNRASEVGLDWDPDVFAALQQDGCDLLGVGFTEKELAKILDTVAGPSGGGEEVADDATERFAVLVMCKNDSDQTKMIDRLTKEGRECRALMS